MTTSTNSTFEEEIAAQDASAHAHLVDLAYAISVVNEALKPLEEQKRKYVEELKQLMALGELDEVADLEHGIVARIQHRNGTPVYDLVSAVKAGHDGALIEAAAAGMVRIDHSMLSQFRKKSGAGWADDLAKYEGPGTGSDALIVGEPK